MNTKSSRKREIAATRAMMCIITALQFSCAGSQVFTEDTREISIEVREGTELAFDLSPDGKTIVFDLLGQIWLLPSAGGEARAITNSILENTEQLYPTFTADGKRIVFWEARPSSWGLSSMDLEGKERRVLTELSSSLMDMGMDRFIACSPVKNEVVFVRGGKLMLMNDSGGSIPVELNVKGVLPMGITDPAWFPDGSRLAFVNATPNYSSRSGGRVWHVVATGDTAKPLTGEKIEVRSPCYSPEGRRIAYFVSNEDLDFEIWVWNLDESEPRKVVMHKDIIPLRLCWSRDGKDLIYCAEGRFWKVAAEGGQPREIPFVARLRFSQYQPNLRSVQFPRPEQDQRARGHMGLEISPDGKKIAAIALGRLWAWDVGKEPTAVSKLPMSASGICWSPDNSEVAWSAGVPGSVDLFATNIRSGQSRRLTAIPGTEVRTSWSPDGKYLAFVYRKNPEPGASIQRSYESFRVLQLSDAPVADIAQTSELQSYPYWGQSLILSQGRHWGRPWSPDSKQILGESGGKPALIPLKGNVLPLRESRELPFFYTSPLWESSGSLLYQWNFAIWRAPFDAQKGIRGEPIPISDDPALYPSISNDGSILYVSSDGLRLRRPGGDAQNLGWPLSYKSAAAPEPVLIRKVRIIDGSGAAMTQPCDILVEGGRISAIAPSGQIQNHRNVATVEADGRVVIPGMIDSHMHIWDKVLLPELLYEGITTIRETGTGQVAWLKGFQELVAAGIQSGPRIVLGFSIAFPWLGSSSQPIGHPYGETSVIRALSLAGGFDFDFVKVFMPLNAYSGNKCIQMAHERKFPVSSHNGYPLSLVASGVDSKEHAVGMLALGPRVGGALHDDIIQLTKASGMGIVPTLYAVAGPFRTESEETKNSPFLSWLPGFVELVGRSPASERRLRKEMLVGRDNATRLYRAGVPLAVGTDIPSAPWTPWALHKELEEYVAAGLSPLEAIMTATRNGARLLRAEREIGTIEAGKLADLVILDANPLEDIKNTRKIWKVIQGGKVVDRDALLNWTKREAEEVALIGK